MEQLPAVSSPGTQPRVSVTFPKEAEGFVERQVVSSSVFIPQILAKKVYTLYSLAVQQLSRQDHYDFGLRALTSLLRYAGKKRRLQQDLSDEEVDQGHGS